MIEKVLKKCEQGQLHEELVIVLEDPINNTVEGRYLQVSRPVKDGDYIVRLHGEWSKTQEKKFSQACKDHEPIDREAARKQELEDCQTFDDLKEWYSKWFL